MSDKSIEKFRYDKRASEILDDLSNLNNLQKQYLLNPIEDYYDLIKSIPKSSRILEIGAGMGEHSEPILKAGHILHATDISSESVKIMMKKFKHYENFSSEVSDMESLDYDNESFDVVVSAGSLSYGDNDTVLNEIYRVLKKDGIFIALDSLNHNPIYRFNRYLHFLKGNRSKSTIVRMPDIKLINKYEQKFGHARVRYFDSIVWVLPFLNIFIDEKKLRRLSNLIDKNLNIKKSAFKFTIKATKL